MTNESGNSNGVKHVVRGNPDDLSGRRLYVRDLCKNYGPKLVLENIDLAVNSGELCSLVGPSGCGKSTLLRLILGQERPNKESIILIDGEPAGYPDPSRGIVFQKYSLYPHLTVLENVMLGKQLSMNMLARFVQRKAMREEVMYYLSQVRLSDATRKYPHELSGGMQQRAAIAQALIMRPKILLMDEPFGALDPEVRERAQVFLLEMWDKYKMTIFFVTHDLEEAAFVGTRIVVLSQYYVDDRGDSPEVKRGSRITADYKLQPHAVSTEVKKTADFGEFVEDVRAQFNPMRRRHVMEFNLSHPDSFQTLSEDEYGARFCAIKQ